MNRIILIYGMPCAGKTTACDLLKSSGFINQIRTDEVRAKHFPVPTYNEQESNNVFDCLFAELQEMMAKSLPDIIVEGVFATDGRILKIKEFASTLNCGVCCVFLHASLQSLLLRNDKRLDTSKHLEPARYQMFRNRFNSQPLADLSVDTENHTKDATAQLIKNYLQNGR